jgi:hypothetical protein
MSRWVDFLRLSRGDESARCPHRVPHAALGGTHGQCDRLRHIARHLAASPGALLDLPRTSDLGARMGRGRAWRPAVMLFSSATIAGLTRDEFARQTGVDLSVERLARIADTVRTALRQFAVRARSRGCGPATSPEDGRAGGRCLGAKPPVLRQALTVLP